MTRAWTGYTAKQRPPSEGTTLEHTSQVLTYFGDDPYGLLSPKPSREAKKTVKRWERDD